MVVLFPSRALVQAPGSDPHWDWLKQKGQNGSFEEHFSHPVEIFDMNKGLARHFLSKAEIDAGSWISQALKVGLPRSVWLARSIVAAAWQQLMLAAAQRWLRTHQSCWVRPASAIRPHNVGRERPNNVI